MATVSCTNKSVAGFTFQAEEPLRPYALNYLAASGMFDSIVIITKDRARLEASGAELIRLADRVGPLERPSVPIDPDHRCNSVNCNHPNHR